MTEQNYFKGRVNKYSDYTNSQLLIEHARVSREVASLPNIPRSEMSQKQLWQSSSKENLAEVQHEMKFRRMAIPETPPDVQVLLLKQQEIELAKKLEAVRGKIAEFGDVDA